jgi:hypothetical protein
MKKTNNRMICLTSGMLGEFEIIKTNATDGLIEEQLRLNCRKEVDGEEIDEAYGLIEEQGYTVELVGSHSSMDDIPDEVNNTFDWYDYYPEEV